MRALADWWDAVELWVTQLPFPFQVVLAIVVVLPVCWGCATVLDRIAGVVLAWVPGRRGPVAPPSGPVSPPTGTPLVGDPAVPGGHAPSAGPDGP